MPDYEIEFMPEISSKQVLDAYSRKKMEEEIRRARAEALAGSSLLTRIGASAMQAISPERYWSLVNDGQDSGTAYSRFIDLIFGNK